MKLLRQLLAPVILGATAATASLSAWAAPVSFTNPDFETGNLNGWSTLGAVIATPSTSVTTFDGTVWTVNAAGTTMAQLISSGADVSTIESTLGLTAGTLNALNTNPNGGDLTNGSALYQAFSANAGDTLSFAWNYVATDYIPFNDPAFAILIGSAASSVQVLASIHGLGTAVGTSGNSGWMNFSATIADAGNYTLAFVTTNDKDTGWNSVLHIDATAGTVPEPGTLMLLSLALAGMGFVARRNKSA